MADPLIEGIANPGPKSGITSVVSNLQDSLRGHLLPANTSTDANDDTEGVEDKRESLAILASLYSKRLSRCSNESW